MSNRADCTWILRVSPPEFERRIDRYGAIDLSVHEAHLNPNSIWSDFSHPDNSASCCLQCESSARFRPGRSHASSTNPRCKKRFDSGSPLPLNCACLVGHFRVKQEERYRSMSEVRRVIELPKSNACAIVHWILPADPGANFIFYWMVPDKWIILSRN